MNPDYLSKLLNKHRAHIPDEEAEFAKFLNSIDKSASEKAICAGMALLHFIRKGNIAMDDAEFASYEAAKFFGVNEFDFNGISECGFIGNPDENTVLILEEGLLYTHKSRKYEQELAEWLFEKSQETHALSTSDNEFIDHLFDETRGEVDLQRVAVKLGLIKDLVVISGGPGTGKTYTVSKIIEAYRQSLGAEKTIALAAPTGKAAQRLNDSLGESINRFDVQEATTLHALLGARGSNFQFTKNKRNPLDVNLLIVDEASMLDLGLWVAMIRALPINSKLVVLGDRHQLSSVESGSILGDICSNSDASFSKNLLTELREDVPVSHKSGFNDCIITLSKSYRFESKSGIQQLADFIKNEDAVSALDLLDSEEFSDVKMMPHTIKESVIQNYVIAPFKELKSAEHPFSIINKNRVLCALRVGKTGVEEWNQLSEKLLKKTYGIAHRATWYSGRPVLVTRNNKALKLRNGEVGIYDSRRTEVTFEDRETGVLPSRLNAFEPAFCLTIHKSQGSEYDHVAVVLPEGENKILSKELLYTAVTRARQSVLIVGDRKTISYCISNPTKRKSGLKQKIWGNRP